MDGNVTVTGASSLAADNQAAIVANGNVKITGTSTDNSFFQGLVYAKGEEGVSVVNSTVLGTVISARADAPTVLDRAEVVFNPASVSTTTSVGWSGGAPNFPVQVYSSTGPTQAHLVLANVTLDDSSQGTPTPAWFLAHGRTSLQSTDFVLVDGSGNVLPDSVSSTQAAAAIAACNGELSALESTPSLDTGSFKLDLNQFLKSSGSLHIVTRRNYS